MKKTIPEQFRKRVYAHAKEHFRAMPWRDSTKPYYILVSEVMLQQTQVDRVIPKFNAFIEAFPTIRDLAEVDFKKVLQLWTGLGYNRRALWLHEGAKQIVENYDGLIPESMDELVKIKGIGPNTAAAICVYAFNKPEVFVETNIRTVYIYEFFPDNNDVHDKDILHLVEETLDKKNPRKWYWALMDYGVFLKKTHGNLSRKSKHYAKQSKFEGSERQIRGAILKLFANSDYSSASLPKLVLDLDFEEDRIEKNAKNLVKDGILVCDKKGKYSVA